MGAKVSTIGKDLNEWANATDSESKRVEQFIFYESELLDQWRIHEWLELFAPEGVYMVPATDKPDGDPETDLFLIHDDRFLLEQRANSLLTRAAHAEYPHSRTRRMVTNIRVHATDGKHIEVRANFAIFRIRAGNIDTYIGRYHHIIVADHEHAFRFVQRKAILDLDSLRPHGKVSIIL